MTRGERRRLRKQARAEGRPLAGELTLDRGDSQCEFSETPKGRRALDKWAKHYDSLNGAPDSPDD